MLVVAKAQIALKFSEWQEKISHFGYEIKITFLPKVKPTLCTFNGKVSK